MIIQAVGIDLSKKVFHLVGLDASGGVVVRKRCSRAQLLAYTANVSVGVIGMEDCNGSHFLGRVLREQGHEVRLLPAQYVKPYVKTNKSDYIDAEAIAEAVRRPTLRCVPIAHAKLSKSFRVLLAQLKSELDQLEVRIEQLDQAIQETARDNEACQHITTRGPWTNSLRR